MSWWNITSTDQGSASTDLDCISKKTKTKQTPTPPPSPNQTPNKATPKPCYYEANSCLLNKTLCWDLRFDKMQAKVWLLALLSNYSTTSVSSLLVLQAFVFCTWKLSVNKVVIYFPPLSDVMYIATYKGVKEVESWFPLERKKTKNGKLKFWKRCSVTKLKHPQEKHWVIWIMLGILLF